MYKITKHKWKGQVSQRDFRLSDDKETVHSLFRGCWQLTRAFLGSPLPEPLTVLNLPWNNSLMWHAAWHKAQSHLFSCESLHSFTQTPSQRDLAASTKKGETERAGGQRLARRSWKPTSRCYPYSSWRDEWIKTEAPLCLFRLCRSVWPQERNPVGKRSQGDSWTQRPVHKPEFGAINGTHILRLQIPFCYSVRCVISTSSCEKQGYARYSLTGFFEKL